MSARHIDTSTFGGRLTRAARPSVILSWTLVVAIALFLWPATFGGRFGMVIVAGTSMEPTYELGDALITWKEPVEVGDVILYRIPEGVHGEGNPVIHRIVGGDGNGWVTQGDNIPIEDKWKPTNEDVLGKPVFMIPAGGYFLNLMRSWWFVALLGGLAVGLMVWPDEVKDEEEELAPTPAPARRRRGRHKAPPKILAWR